VFGAACNIQGGLSSIKMLQCRQPNNLPWPGMVWIPAISFWEFGIYGIYGISLNRRPMIPLNNAWIGGVMVISIACCLRRAQGQGQHAEVHSGLIMNWPVSMFTRLRWGLSHTNCKIRPKPKSQYLLKSAFVEHFQEIHQPVVFNKKFHHPMFDGYPFIKRWIWEWFTNVTWNLLFLIC
jgi:hypothetical protein